MAPANSKIERTFTQDRETRNAIRYAEDVDNGERGTIGNVYVLKTDLEELGTPERIKVTVTAIK